MRRDQSRVGVTCSEASTEQAHPRSSDSSPDTSQHGGAQPEGPSGRSSPGVAAAAASAQAATQKWADASHAAGAAGADATCGPSDHRTDTFNPPKLQQRPSPNRPLQEHHSSGISGTTLASMVDSRTSGAMDEPNPFSDAETQRCLQVPPNCSACVAALGARWICCLESLASLRLFTSMARRDFP